MAPITGSMKYLPKAMTMPEMASSEKVMAVDQCSTRSYGVKRSILRPVSFTGPPNGPLAR